jgi:amino acid transporter
MTQQTESPIPPPIARPGRKSRVPLFGATAITAGVYISAALGYDPTHPKDSFLWASTFGLPGLAMVFGVSFGALAFLVRRLGRLAHRDRWLRFLLTGCVVASAGLVVHSCWAAQPINLFRSEVLSPAPGSLTDLRVTKYTSFSDGHAWLFAFHVSPGDFDDLRDRLELKRLPVDLAQRRKSLAEILDGTESPDQIRQITYQVFPEDQVLTSWELYTRPAEPEFYSSGHITLVTDASRSTVYLHIDR